MKNDKQCQQAGFVDRKWMMVILVATLAGYIGLYFYVQHRKSEICIQHLKEIHSALGWYAFDRARLPNLAFYPEHPKEDADSMVVAMKKFGADARSFSCPATNPLIRETGLSYVWNISLNGKSLKDIKDPVWMLVEVNALSDEIPPPHLGRYHILYTDGRVVLSDRPPEDLNNLNR